MIFNINVENKDSLTLNKLKTNNNELISALTKIVKHEQSVHGNSDSLCYIFNVSDNKHINYNTSKNYNAIYIQGISDSWIIKSTAYHLILGYIQIDNVYFIVKSFDDTLTNTFLKQFEILNQSKVFSFDQYKIVDDDLDDDSIIRIQCNLYFNTKDYNEIIVDCYNEYGEINFK